MKGEIQRIHYNPTTKRYVVSGLHGTQPTNLVCDTETKVVYYRGMEFMSPYISENGKFCRLIDDQIVEID